MFIREPLIVSYFIKRLYNIGVRDVVDATLRISLAKKFRRASLIEISRPRTKPNEPPVLESKLDHFRNQNLKYIASYRPVDVKALRYKGLNTYLKLAEHSETAGNHSDNQGKLSDAGA